MWYWTAVTILMLTNLASLLGSLLLLPGNWVMVTALAGFVWLFPEPEGPNWTTVLVAAALAGLAELVEMVSGSMAASGKGASRRAVLLSFVLSLAGSVAGAIVVPIPVVGSAAGAIGGAAMGAFTGAWLGEVWVGSDARKRQQVGTAAMIGRMLGMLAKISMGVAILVLEIVQLWP